jgi:hypothetical protein
MDNPTQIDPHTPTMLDDEMPEIDVDVQSVYWLIMTVGWDAAVKDQVPDLVN